MITRRHWKKVAGGGREEIALAARAGDDPGDHPIFFYRAERYYWLQRRL